MWMQFGKMYLICSQAYVYYMNIDLKHIALQLCTCTWIEIMTGAGITLYLTYLQNYMLAVLTLAVFSPLIGFHFAMTRLSKSEDYCTSAACMRRSRFSNTIAGTEMPQINSKVRD
jgi:hypothetical protein